ncbi:glycosyltransferase family 10 domain-containing protein [Rhodobacter sp. TJ_12]|uniref:glycosyltransferase family 10 domain-containing protein n=1 Tax=Rhodobacter sp. TJ_12 TaxID=2029399 RepID=UPI001CBE93BE|nr:glycosyltransferase family 10 [Rhodobacter sp. TJ_12]
MRGLRLTDRPEQADILFISHPKELDQIPQILPITLAPGQKLVLLSEEPFWDTVWGRDPLRRHQLLQTPDGPVPVTVLNHCTSTLYEFDEIPYFLLTNHHFSTRYGLWFRRNATRSAADWAAHFHTVPLQAAFLMRYRLDPFYDATFAEDTVFSLNNRRTEIARACHGPGMLREGTGWGDTPPRQSLPDWHLDKFLHLNRRCRFLGAIENTHQTHYISEKIFDAWAVGAIPLYEARPGHRVHDLARPGSWLNTDGMAPADIPHIMTQTATTMKTEGFEAYAAQQARLARLFSDPGPLHRELNRLHAALLREFNAVLAEPATR